MKGITITSCLALLSVGQAFSQSGAVIPQGGAGHAVQASCLILKRMGPADQVTSRLYSFGLRGKQFQYVEGKLPDGFPFHGRLTDHDVRNLQDRGAEVIILNQDFTSEDLTHAREDCRGETGKAPNQASEKSLLDLSSTPTGAEISIDGNFVGNTPSSLSVAAGDHTVSIKMAGYQSWDRKVRTSGGKVNLTTTLVKSDAKETASPNSKQPDSAAQNSPPQN